MSKVEIMRIPLVGWMMRLARDIPLERGDRESGQAALEEVWAALAAGGSALDAVEMMNFGANLMREHVLPDSRIHYVITSGGSAPNVIPDFAEVFYYDEVM